jgi:hypothetical protein
VNAYNYISKNIFVKLKPSKIDGVGVFAIEIYQKILFYLKLGKVIVDIPY